MSDEFQVSLKTVCCTCLNTDRKLQKLCRISEGVNLLYLLLSHDPDAYKEIFYKDSTSLHLCWECAAIMRKIRLFQVQASRAIRDLNNFCNNSEKDTKPLSNLSTYIFTTNETILQDTLEHFIDCGTYIKTQLDPDDIPLSQLNNYENYRPEAITRTIEHKKPTHKTITKPKDLNNYEKVYKTVSNYENDILESQYSPIREYEKSHSPIQSYKQAHNIITKPKDLKNLEKGHEKDSEDENDPQKSLKTPIRHYKQAHKAITKPKDLKNLEKSHNNYSEDEIDLQESLKSPIRHYKKAYKTITKPIDLKRDERNQEISPKCYKKKIYIFGGNKKKRKKTVFSDVKLEYPCPECNSCFENKNLRWKHIQKLHREGHQCSVCEKRFALKSNLQRHEKIHSSPPPRQKCPTCSKSVRVDLMQAHSLTHTDRQKYSCISCDKTFVCRDTYHSHLKYSRAHCQEDVLARYKCSTCDKRYRSQAELRDHINYQHKGQTEHKCPVCGKGLATKRCIRRHVRRAHEGIKENARDKICQRCGKAFRDAKSLREHEYIHTGERPLSCELCGQTFRQYASLYSHRKRVHKLIVPQKTVIVLDKDCG